MDLPDTSLTIPMVGKPLEQKAPKNTQLITPKLEKSRKIEREAIPVGI